MNKIVASTIIKDYFKAWVQQDKELFLSLLHNDVIVKECTGDMYTNKEISRKWFEGWNTNGNQVVSWDISNHFYDEARQVAVVTWIFECMYDSNNYIFEGSSIVQFKDDLIIKLDEYQMELDKKYPYGV